MYVDEFLKYISSEKRFSEHTILAYENDLKTFLYFIEQQFQINRVKEISHFMIRSWLVSLSEENINNRSINRKISTLKTYFKFLLRNNLLENNPMNKIISPKTEKRLPVFVKETDMDKLLSATFFDETYKGQRDRLILELFYNTGMRLAELINIKLQDVDLSSSLVKVTGKRNKQRIIPLTQFITSLLEQFVELREIEFEDNEAAEPYFILTGKGKKLYPKLVYNIVHQYLEMATTIEKKSPHVLRHTFATHMLNNGADLNTIKEILGHTNLSATQVYTHNTLDKLKQTYKKAHPREK